jgi:hypothetical protein
MTAPWSNRITRHGAAAPAELLAHPLNARRHPKAQADAVAGLLSEVGWVADVIVNERSGRIVDGHLRVHLAIERAEPTVPVVYVDLDDDEERLVLATLDPLAAMAATDADALASLLASVATSDAALQAALDRLGQDAGVLAPDDPLAEWQGMPEFEQEDQTAYRSLHVHFADEAAVHDFMERIGQTFSDKARYIWHPRQERADFMTHRYAAE